MRLSDSNAFWKRRVATSCLRMGSLHCIGRDYIAVSKVISPKMQYNAVNHDAQGRFATSCLRMRFHVCVVIESTYLGSFMSMETSLRTSKTHPMQKTNACGMSKRAINIIKLSNRSFLSRRFTLFRFNIRIRRLIDILRASIVWL